jgi:DNA mismatch repair protein MutS
MTFRSILFDEPTDAAESASNEPSIFFGDLNLTQLVDRITAAFKEYELPPLYYSRPRNFNTISYRQQVVRDLERESLFKAIRDFSGKMRSMRERLEQAKKFFYKYANQRGFLGAVEIYCEAVERLTFDICAHAVASQGLIAFRDFLAAYVSSPRFQELIAEIKNLKASLSAIRYCLLLKGDSVTVRAPEDESDYSTSVEETFAKFRSDTAQKYWVNVREIDPVNHIQAQVLDGIAKLHPAVFASLEAFRTRYEEYLDRTIARFDREVQFYIAFLTYVEKLRSAGLSFCQPELSQTSKEISAHNAFDLVLAGKLIDEKASVVTNDFFLAGPERIFVVSGPNHGGKTTFARMLGQMHYLASLGLPVPGAEAHLFVFDRLFTHFEREESIKSLRGKLQDDLLRVRQILDYATPDSLLIMNEIFSSTTLQDALYLSKRILARLSALDLLCVCVTFLDELASFNEKTVSVVSTVDLDNPAIRTYKLERRPADGLAYALAIAQKHRVTYELLKERIKG